jgi:threonine synthase
MDIQVSSNFERLLFDAGGRDGTALADQMRGFETSRAMRLTNAQREGAAHLFASARVDADGMTMAMRWAYDAAAQKLVSMFADNFGQYLPFIAADVKAAAIG